MKVWNKAPLIRLLIPFSLGIFIAVQFPFHLYNKLLCVFLILLISLLLKPHLPYKHEWWKGLIINTVLLLLGYQLTISDRAKAFSVYSCGNPSNQEYAIIRITQAPIKKISSVKTIACIIAIKNGEHWKPVNEKVLVYFKKDEKSSQLNYGDELITKAYFVKVAPPQNPNEFDYKKYLSYRDIYFQTFLKSSEWLLTGKNTGNEFIAATITLRNKLLKALSDYGIKGDEFAVGSALLLGYEDELNNELLSSYSVVGVIHLLSVSGLHIGIVYLVFNWLFSFLEKIKKGNIIKAVFVLFTLWLYAAITNFSPSVLRATTMFTFIVIGKAANKNSNVYNTLAASAFLLLLTNPFILMDVGFQLSYLAVIGIITVYPKIYSLINIDNKVVDITWKMTSVSIAAQIATFPLCIYYFHQFPNYFLLANLIAIPLSTLIIYLGILFFLFSKIQAIASVLAYLFKSCVHLLNSVILKFEQLPYSSYSGIDITAFEMLLMYGLLILVCCYFIHPRVKLLMASFSLLVLLLGIQMIEQHQQQHQKKLIIYNIPKASVVDFVTGKNNVLLADSILSKNKSALSFHIKNYWSKLGIEKTQTTDSNFKTGNLHINGKHILFCNKRIILLKDADRVSEIPVNPIKIDYLILSNNCKSTIEEVLKIYDPNLIVFDSSNNKYRIKKWQQECRKNNMAFYSVINSGALVVDL
jgi:competence protein ComEC